MGNTLGKLQTRVNELEKRLVELQDKNSELIEEKKSLTSKLKYLEENFDKKLEIALTKAVKEVSEKYEKIIKEKDKYFMQTFDEKLAEEKGNRVSLEEYVEYIEGQGIPTKQENGRTYAEVEGKIYEIKMENGRIEIEYIEEGHIDDPRIQEIEVIEKTLNSIKIKVEAMRMEGGTYYYYIGTDQDKLEEKGNNQEGEYMDWL